MVEMNFSFDKETLAMVKALGYIPPGCYGTPVKGVFIQEHADKNREIVRQHLAQAEANSKKSASNSCECYGGDA